MGIMARLVMRIKQCCGPEAWEPGVADCEAFPSLAKLLSQPSNNCERLAHNACIVLTLLAASDHIS